MTTIKERLDAVLQQIVCHCEACGRDPASVELLPISKKHSTSKVCEILDLGITTLGENRVQELVQKAGELQQQDIDINWHMVGSVQTNKARQLLHVPNLTLLQSLDRLSLANALQKVLANQGRKLPVLLQINATSEDSKHGCAPDQAKELVAQVRRDCSALKLQGVMAMGPLEGDPAPVFKDVAALHRDLKQTTGLDLPILSMGMTDDMAAAIAAGSTMVRVGTGVFGPRE